MSIVTLLHHVQLTNHFPYDLLAEVSDGVFLDVGAGSGSITSLVRKYSSDITVIMYEPFPNNIEFIRPLLDADSNLTLIEKAVSNESGRGHLYVSAVVTGNEQGWEHMVGYSSAGRLVTETNRFDQQKVYSVDLCTIDNTVDQHVCMMKIDVQGGELGVLQGAKETVERAGIDMIYLEFSGEEDVLTWLVEHDYLILDTEYLVIPQEPLSDDQLKRFSAYSVRNLSNGRQAISGFLKDVDDRTFSSYCDWFETTRQQLGRMQTDLLCVHRTFIQDFLRILSRALQK